MAGYFTRAQLGSSMFFQVAKAFSRQASSHSGSPFFSEISRTMSSFNPFGNSSIAISVVNPYLYLDAVSASTVSRVSAIAGIRQPHSRNQRQGYGRHAGFRLSPCPQG